MGDDRWMDTDTSGSHPYWAGVFASMVIGLVMAAVGAPIPAAAFCGFVLGIATVGAYLVCVMPVGGPSR
jgi:hypothetical protein